MSITQEALKKAGLQYGYSRTRRHPSVKPFVEGNYNGVDFINLEKTETQLKDAISFLTSVNSAGKVILFIGVKPEIRQIVKEVALSLNAPYIAERFIGGTFTNFPQIKKRIEMLHDLLKKKETGELAVYTKKEQLLIQRDIDRLDRDFGGISSLTNTPDVIVMIDSRHEDMCVKEAKRLHIPVVALCSTDCTIEGIEYPIVGNDGSVASVRFVLEAIKSALQEQVA
ncbi:30S ribosomal protein S2 [Candidatus Gracilibacteria bacterium]|nr:30S ribosomal protein S2 [Candidatus Gracilibacteria bacterium]MCF7898856.1 30S ribosomal protein S2 [Candidatus Paceibacterota bacterium]